MSILDDLAERLNRKKAAFGPIVNAAGIQLQNDSKANASWADQTGNARQMIHSTVTGGGLHYNINVSHGVDYGGILEEGSSPHVIRPKSKQALYWDGAEHPVKMVNHPGTSKYNGIRSTVESEAPEIGQKLAEYWSDL
ncbi:hypothetical protein [Peptostreptococcus anaerobius]